MFYNFIYISIFSLTINWFLITIKKNIYQQFVIVMILYMHNIIRLYKFKISADVFKLKYNMSRDYNTQVK